MKDIAYCLLGIFDVSMLMLYGEGGEAFARLQEGIAEKTNGLSLFVWQARALEASNSGGAGAQKYRDILAPPLQLSYLTPAPSWQATMRGSTRSSS